MTQNETPVAMAGQAETGRLSKAAWHWPAWLTIAIPVLAELLVGGYRIATPSLWRDEASTISGSARPISAIWAMVQHQDAVHGPYYVVMHYVIAIAGRSETVLRTPSLIAMCATAGLLAALGRRLAKAGQVPTPELTGLLAGLLLVAVPLTTRYAQEARPYAFASLFAVLATYLLVRTWPSGRWPGWVGYAIALVLTGAFNLFGLLIVLPHGISLLAARDRNSNRAAIVPWAASAVIALAIVAPLITQSASQSAQLNWVAKPDASTVASLMRDFAGATALIPLVGAVAVLGCLAGTGLRRRAGLTLAVVALPWLVLPPVLLIAASLVHPVYVERYVIFCLPALSLLAAAGITWLGKLVRGALPGVGWLAAAAVVAALAVISGAVAGAQIAIRQAGSRPDNLRAVAAALAAHERRGDAIAYLPWDTSTVSMAYPAPFDGLSDVELGQSPVASGTLRGLVAPPALIAARLRGSARLWVVRWAPSASGAAGTSPSDRYVAHVAAGSPVIGQWRIGSVILTLYALSGHS